MAKSKQEQSGKESLPGKMPETTPPNMGLDQHSWILQATMEMQKSLGKLENAVSTLVTSEADTKTKLGRIEKTMYAAGVVLVAALAVGGWMINTAKDFAMTYFKTSIEAQKPLENISPQQKTNKNH